MHREIGDCWKIEFGDGKVLEACTFEELQAMIDGRPDVPLRMWKSEQGCYVEDSGGSGAPR